MNERIRELADKAWKEVLSETSIEGDTSNVYSPDEVVAFEQKFAELIVNECAKIVEDSTLNLPHGYKAVDQANLVKQHFGVEE
jgi:hypothetical protein